MIVFAGARNPTAAEDLQSLVQQFPGKVHIVKLTSCDKTDNDAAIATIKSVAGRLDVVIACAGKFLFSRLFVRTWIHFRTGISQFFGTSLETPVEQMRDHFEVNTDL